MTEPPIARKSSARWPATVILDAIDEWLLKRTTDGYRAGAVDAAIRGQKKPAPILTVSARMGGVEEKKRPRNAASLFCVCFWR